MGTPSTVWHYTTAAGLIGMLESGRLWATAAAMMNDSQELQAGRDAFAAAIQRRKGSLAAWQVAALEEVRSQLIADPENVFLLCASTEEDSLTLWRSYGVGSEAEYAVELDTGVALVPVVQRAESEHPAPPRDWQRGYGPSDGDFIEWPPGYDPDEPSVARGEWRSVDYLDPQESPVERFVGQVPSVVEEPDEGDPWSLLWARYSIDEIDPTMFIKHRGFEDEREARAVWNPWPWWRFVRYRSGRFGVTPYIEVAARVPLEERETRPLGGWGEYALPENIALLPIRSVRIGPTRAPQNSVRALRELLDVHGYGDVEILESETPYR